MSEFALETLKSFDRDIRTIDGQMKKRLVSKLELMKVSGMPSDVDAVQCAPGCFRTKLGDYRLVFRFKDGVFLLVLFCPRKDVYERLKRRVA